jgi:predicted neutral ceramidase superfamily lipid hydrolase
MPFSTRFADILGAVSGVAFAVLLFLSVAAVDPQRGVPDQDLQNWWSDSGNRTGFIISMYTLLVACPLFLLFVSRLRMRLLAADASGWADSVFACGIIATTALGICAVTRGVVASSIRFEDLVILFMAVLVAGVSVLALATHPLPSWIGWLGLPVSVGGLILLAIHIAPFSIPLFIIWVVANSVYLLRTPAVVQVARPTQQPGFSNAQA